MLGDRYTLVYVDQITGAQFTLQRTPVGTFISGGFEGPEALELVSAIVIDQTLEQIAAGS